MLQAGILPEIGSFMACSLKNETYSRKFGLLLIVYTGRSASRTALVRFKIFGALVLAVKPWIVPYLLLTCVLQVRILLLLTEYSIVPLRKLHSSVQ